MQVVLHTVFLELGIKECFNYLSIILKLIIFRYMLGLAGIPSLIQFIGFIFMPESPRWLVGKQRNTQATTILMRIRGTQDVEEEMYQIKKTTDEERRIVESRGEAVTIDLL